MTATMICKRMMFTSKLSILMLVLDVTPNHFNVGGPGETEVVTGGHLEEVDGGGRETGGGNGDRNPT